MLGLLQASSVLDDLLGRHEQQRLLSMLEELIPGASALETISPACTIVAFADWLQCCDCRIEMWLVVAQHDVLDLVEEIGDVGHQDVARGSYPFTVVVSKRLGELHQQGDILHEVHEDRPLFISVGLVGCEHVLWAAAKSLERMQSCLRLESMIPSVQGFAERPIALVGQGVLCHEVVDHQGGLEAIRRGLDAGA